MPIPNSQALPALVVVMSDDFVLPRTGSLEDPIRVAVMISGGGSGLAALLQYQRTSRTHQTTLVIADKEDADGLQHSIDAGVPSLGIPIPMEAEAKERRVTHERLVHAALGEHDIELVVLSGYMRILTPWFVRRWKGRLVNIHPSLLPDFPGAHAHRDVLTAGVDVSGCTVHMVDEGVDTGPILAQVQVDVNEGDDETSLQERIKQVEHVLYPETLDRLCSGQISL
tara:strand:+ start:2732 stop:3409 length:678 start_codon:yes stop_codon:yes gene_type:complete